MLAFNESQLKELEKKGFDFGTSDPWAIADASGNFLFATAAYANMLDYSVQELLKLNVHEIWCGKYEMDGERTDDGARIVYRQCKTKRQVVVKLRVKNYKFTFNGKIYYAACVLSHKVLDTSDNYYRSWKQRQIDAPATQLSNLNKISLLNDSVLGYTIVAVNSDILWVNKAWAKNLGYKPEELILTKSTIDTALALYTPMIDDNVTQIKTDVTPWLLKKYRHRTGTEVWARVRSQKYIYQGLQVHFNCASFIANANQNLMQKLDENFLDGILGKDLRMQLSAKNLGRVASLLNITSAELAVMIQHLQDCSVVDLDGEEGGKPQLDLF